MRFLFSYLALAGLVLSCKSTAPLPCPQNLPDAPAPKPMAQAPAKTEPSPQAEAAPAQQPVSLHLSTLPEDTMSVAQLRAATGYEEALQRALDLEPASSQRSLPLSTRLPLIQLASLTPPPFPYDTRPLAIVWDAKQRAIWIWPQQDLSLSARQALEAKLQAQTRFEAPYWILESETDPLSYFVHTKAHWLIACPKTWAPQIRSWLRDTSLTRIGRLSWAPNQTQSTPLVLRWRAPQLLESAPEANTPLPVIGELEVQTQTAGTTPQVTINGQTRSTP